MIQVSMLQMYRRMEIRLNITYHIDFINRANTGYVEITEYSDRFTYNNMNILIKIIITMSLLQLACL